MKRSNLLKGISAVAVAFALCLGITGTAQAAKTDASVVQSEITQLGVDAPGIALKESSGTGQATTSWTVNFPVVPEGYELWFNVYNPDTPLESETGSWSKDKYGRDIYSPGWSYRIEPSATRTDYTRVFEAESFTPGKKNIVAYFYAEKAYEDACDAAYDAYKKAYDAAWEAGQNPVWDSDAIAYPSKADYISPASAPISIDVTLVASVSTVVKSTSIELDMHAGKATGYEVYRKVGKKYQKVATVASNIYKDQGLLSKTEYSYKVRPYYKDSNSGKIYYGKYTQLERTTKGSSLQLKLKVQKTKNVKLSWKKVNGAVRYEIYRYAGSSDATTISKGVYDSFGQYKLIKTLGKSKKSYVDKKTVANQTYSYVVRAILPADKKVKGDKDTYIEQYASVSFTFDRPEEVTRYEDAYGNVTVEWKKAYGVDGYAIFKYDSTQSAYVDTGIRLNKNTTKYKFVAETNIESDGYWDNDAASYRLYSYKGTKISDRYISVYPTKRAGLVSKVTAKKVANGVQVSWTPVNGATYYRVYRTQSDSLLKDKDIGGYDNCYDELVTEYVGAATPVEVDIAAYNAGIDAAEAADEAAYKAYTESDAYKAWWNEDWDDYDAWYARRPAEPTYSVYNYSHYSFDYDYYKLDVNNGPYYYQNYSYAQSEFFTTSIVDYYGDIYTGYMSNAYYKDNEAVLEQTPYVAPTANAVKYNRPQEGTNYQYYVVAYFATPWTVEDYINDGDTALDFTRDTQVLGAVPGTNTGGIVATMPYPCDGYGSEVDINWKWSNLQQTIGCGKVGTATFSTVKAPAKAKIKSLSSSKKTVTIKIKKVKGATGYKIYRSTKKKGKYMCVGTSKKVSFKDTGLEAGTTYYYKVVAIKKSQSGSDIEGKASAVKTIKAK